MKFKDNNPITDRKIKGPSIIIIIFTILQNAVFVGGWVHLPKIIIYCAVFFYIGFWGGNGKKLKEIYKCLA